MPLVVHNALDAARIRKSNPVASWGNRLQDNRVEPVAKPAFDVPFKFKRKERIFTIGSCFARNVETELIKRGFRIPMRELLSKPAFDGVDLEVVNNFGTPSIYNELAWAFDAEQFDEARGFIEVQAGKYIDLHMINSIRPASIEILRERRKGLGEAVRMLAKCRVLIITLGLIELWWDEQAQTYLNTAPLPSILKKSPERFALHVLSFEECRDYLDRALDICFANGRKDLQVVLTVSPVPMMYTHRRMDVMTANSYSKSVLRTVAEHIVANRDRVCYFPSYESVIHSDRRIAWSDDFVHVSNDIVAFNVERMVNAFTGRKRAEEPALPDPAQLPQEDVAALLLAERANQARLDSDAAFFVEHADAAMASPAFALEYARFLFDQDSHESVAGLLAEDPRVDAQLIRAQSLMKLRRYGEAIETANMICRHSPKGDLHWRILVNATAAIGAPSDVLEIERRWLDHNPRHRYIVMVTVGRALRRLARYDAAIDRLKEATSIGEKTPIIAIELARCLIATGKNREALRLLEGVEAQNEGHVRLLRSLKERAMERLE
ncbi:MAG: GSCFA domain-containing protein [Pseudomonadota bacterium]